MRLLITSSEFPPGPGGIGTHAFQIARHLARLGWEVRVATCQDYAEREEIRSFNVHQPFRIDTLKSAGNALSMLASRLRALDAAIGDFDPDVLMATGDRQTYLAGVLSRRRKLPWIAVEHGRRPPVWERWLKKHWFAHASAVVFVSEYTRSEIERMGVRTGHGVVIPNGADTEAFRVLPSPLVDQTRRELGLAGARVIVTVGNVSERKGQDVVIRAMPEILGSAPTTQYLCIGLPGERARFEELARRLGVADHVRFLGSVEHDLLLRVLNVADVFAMTSRHTAQQWEGYGIAVVEAALCGVPSVVSAQSGLAEAILDGVTGIAVPEQDRARTAQAVLALLHDEGLRLQMGRAARERALTEQTWQARAVRYDALIRVVRRGAAVADRSTAYAGISA
ncbi:MAG: hypothetical protein DMF89_07300 [Acidobacteria bacterium]|nr:MAG: hypothetical protein DMF89_07300 [Acidobacteriota bacterium]